MDSGPGPGEVTRLLHAWRGGGEAARERLIEHVYAELKKIAGAHLRGERRGQTLEATGLVHEAFLRLMPQTRVDWRDRAHFFGLASTCMRRVLVDRARARAAAKRDPEGYLLTGSPSERSLRPRSCSTSTARWSVWQRSIHVSRRWSRCATSLAWR